MQGKPHGKSLVALKCIKRASQQHKIRTAGGHRVKSSKEEHINFGEAVITSRAAQSVAESR